MNYVFVCSNQDVKFFKSLTCKVDNLLYFSVQETNASFFNLGQELDWMRKKPATVMIIYTGTTGSQISLLHSPFL